MLFACLGVMLVSCHAQPESIHAYDLNHNTKIIGSLEMPLGSLITIDGEMVEDNYLRHKIHSGSDLMRVHSVNNKLLTIPIVIELHTFPFHPIPIPKPGESCSFIGYETGRFSGIPSDASEIIGPVQTSVYFFETYFNICKSGS